jgi:hypothetical protein
LLEGALDQNAGIPVAIIHVRRSACTLIDMTEQGGRWLQN